MSSHNSDSEEPGEERKSESPEKEKEPKKSESESEEESSKKKSESKKSHRKKSDKHDDSKKEKKSKSKRKRHDSDSDRESRSRHRRDKDYDSRRDDRDDDYRREERDYDYRRDDRDDDYRRDRDDDYRRDDKDDRDYSRRRERDYDSRRDDRDYGSRRRNKDSDSRRPDKDSEPKKSDKEELQEKPPSKKDIDPVLTRAGGAYIPPARLKMMMEQSMDKSSEQYQRMSWERLKKKVHGQVNKVNITNIVQVVRELLQENVIRGKGLLASSIIQAQSFSPSFTHVYAALVSIINSKFPNIGELILRRLVIQFKRAFRTNNKATCVIVSTFIGHLANQRVCHELLILQILVVLMENPTDDSIEIAVNLLKVCGQMLTQVTPQGTFAMFEQLRRILEECDEISSRTQYMIEVLFAVRKEKFAAYPSVIEELDLIDEEDQVCHIVNLVSEDNKPLDPELGLNIFKFDPEFEANEAQYDEIRKEIVGDAEDSDEEGNEGGEEAEEGKEEEGEESTVPPSTETHGTVKIIDMTEQEKAAFRRNVYLTIQSSLDFQEAAHKLIKNMLKPGVEAELCHMIVDCCAQQRSYTPFYGKLAERFCKLRKEFQDTFEAIAKDSYLAIHRFDLTKLRNLAMLVAHLLATDAISWEVLSVVKLTEEETTSSGRIYIKIVFTQLCEHLGLIKLDEKLHDPTLYHAFEELFPRDHPKNSRFAINFFSFIGLSGLTLDLRKFLKKKEKKMKEEPAVEDEDSSSSSSSSSDSSDSDSDSSSDSSDSDSDSSSTSSASSEDSSKKNKKKAPLKEIKREVLSEAEESPKIQKEKSRERKKEKEGRENEERNGEKRSRRDDEESRHRRREERDDRRSRRDEEEERESYKRKKHDSENEDDDKEDRRRRRRRDSDNKDEEKEDRRRRRHDSEKDDRRKRHDPEREEKHEKEDHRKKKRHDSDKNEERDSRRRRRHDSDKEEEDKRRERKRRDSGDEDEERENRRSRRHHDSDEKDDRSHKHKDEEENEDKRRRRRGEEDDEEPSRKKSRHDSDREKSRRSEERKRSVSPERRRRRRDS